MPGKLNPVVIEGTRMLFRNFSGAAGRYNTAGKRNFNVPLTEDVAEQMIKDGWNVKHLRAREEGDEPQAILKVSVNFSGRPPRIVMVTSRGKTPLDESMVSLLDWAEIEKVDLIIRPYEWVIDGNPGVTAYLQSLYVTIREDELERKYADVPDSAMSALLPDMDDEEEG